MGIVSAIVVFVRALIWPRASIAAENMALRQQLGVLRRSVKRPRLKRVDRILWVWLSRLWRHWRSVLVIVKPETVIGWHRQGFRLYWCWRSKKKVGRPPIDGEIRQLIRRMAMESPTWGAPRIHSELCLLGQSNCCSSVVIHPRGAHPTDPLTG